MEDFNLSYGEHEEEKDRNRGMIISFTIHIILLLILLLPIIHHTEMTADLQEGIFVNFGNPDQGSGQETAAAQVMEPTEPKESTPPLTPPEPKSEPVPKAPVTVVEPLPKETPQDALVGATFEKVLVTEVDPALEIAQAEKQAKEVERLALIKKEESEKAESERLNNEKEKQRKEAQEAADKAEAQRIALEAQQKQEAEARAKAIAEAKQKAKEAEEARKQAELESKKSAFGDFLGGEGKGDNKNPGNQGDPLGDPNADILVGMSKGAGDIGEGLGDRSVLYEPVIQENSQKTGKVAVRVCVDNSGGVTSARYTQEGSTTSDSDLVEAAVNGAKKYKFSPGQLEEQCGSVVIEFRVR